MFYMANCGDTTCDKFDSTQAKWFKIDEVGLQKDGETWFQANLMTGAPANVTLPSNLAPGNYIIRHEMIALHLANTVGGAEFYPSCSNLKVSGSGTESPGGAPATSFYQSEDPGIHFDVYGEKISSYPIPGPALWSGAGAAATQGTGAVSNAAGSVGSTVPSTDGSSSPAPSTGYGSTPAASTSEGENTDYSGDESGDESGEESGDESGDENEEGSGDESGDENEEGSGVSAPPPYGATPPSTEGPSPTGSSSGPLTTGTSGHGKKGGKGRKGRKHHNKHKSWKGNWAKSNKNERRHARDFM